MTSGLFLTDLEKKNIENNKILFLVRADKHVYRNLQ
jgi:hypothetical protein